MSKPICIDLFCGLGGWSEGFIAEGYDCRGYDIEAHRYPKRIMVKDDAQKMPAGNCSSVLWKDRPIARYAHPALAEMDLHGQATQKWDEYPGTLILRDVRSIHGSEFKDAAVIVASPPCQAYSYRAMPWKRAKALPPPDNTLFNECFRIQREACEAAGRYIPLIVENVRGAQPWVGRARWNYGSFYLWGDVPALMPHTFKAMKTVGHTNIRDGATHTRHLTNPAEFLGRKVAMNFHEHEKTGKPGRSFQSVAVEDHVKVSGIKLREVGFNVAAAQRIDCSPPEGFMRTEEMKRQHIGHRRKAASAMIAKIPFPLSQHIARTFKPEAE